MEEIFFTHVPTGLLEAFQENHLADRGSFDWLTSHIKPFDSLGPSLHIRASRIFFHSSVWAPGLARWDPRKAGFSIWPSSDSHENVCFRLRWTRWQCLFSSSSWENGIRQRIARKPVFGTTSLSMKSPQLSQLRADRAETFEAGPEDVCHHDDSYRKRLSFVPNLLVFQRHWKIPAVPQKN